MNAVKKLKFMSIGGSSAITAILGADRLPSPVDNMIATKGLSSSITLFENTIRQQFLKPPISVSKKLDYTLSEYESWIVAHTDMINEKFFFDFDNKMQSFIEFYQKIDLSKYYFVYCLGRGDIESEDVMSLNFFNGLSYLRKIHVFDKTIIIGTRSKDANMFNFCSDVISSIDDVKYIELNDVSLSDPTKVHEQFLEKVKEIL